MACQLKNIELPDIAAGETWGGLTFAITASDDTDYAAALSRVRMSWKNYAGTVSQTLDSNTAGHITISTATAYGWVFTVNPRVLSLAAGTYTWAIETTDAGSRVNKDALTGTQQVTPDPHA